MAQRLQSMVYSGNLKRSDEYQEVRGDIFFFSFPLNKNSICTSAFIFIYRRSKTNYKKSQLIIQKNAAS